MATLTETAYYTRKIIKISTVLFIALIVIRAAFNIFQKTWQKSHPSPPPPPTFSFGKLPKLNFPESQNLPQLSYKLETVQGGLPKLLTIAKVYFMPKKEANLLALDRANQTAAKFGFKNQPEPISEIIYRWKTDKNPVTILEMNINTNNFHLKYDYENDQELLQNRYLPTNEQAAQEAKSYLQNYGLLPPDLTNGTIEFEYLKTVNLNPAISLSEADFVRINLRRAPLDNIKVLSSNPKKSLIAVLFSGSRETDKRIVEINYTYWPVEPESLATYPLKPVSDAWNQIQANDAYIADLGQNEDEKIIIRQVYLAYYDSEEPQNYLQPIYVFEGDKNFFAYVPAIDPKWTE